MILKTAAIVVAVITFLLSLDNPRFRSVVTFDNSNDWERLVADQLLANPEFTLDFSSRAEYREFVRSLVSSATSDVPPQYFYTTARSNDTWNQWGRLVNRVAEVRRGAGTDENARRSDPGNLPASSASGSSAGRNSLPRDQLPAPRRRTSSVVEQDEDSERFERVRAVPPHERVEVFPAIEIDPATGQERYVPILENYHHANGSIAIPPESEEEGGVDDTFDFDNLPETLNREQIEELHQSTEQRRTQNVNVVAHNQFHGQMGIFQNQGPVTTQTVTAPAEGEPRQNRGEDRIGGQERAGHAGGQNEDSRHQRFDTRNWWTLAALWAAITASPGSESTKASKNDKNRKDKA